MASDAINYLDTILVPLSLFITIGYHAYLWHHLKHKPSHTTIGMNMLKRRSWLRELNQGSEKKGTLAVQSLRNALMETILTATITILITLAMAALTNNTLKVSNLFTSAFFGSQTGKTIVLKYGSATIFLVASFLCSSMALGFLIDANFLVNALGEFSINPRHTETIFERGFTLAFVGDRVLCMTFPLLFWMFGPVPVVVDDEERIGNSIMSTWERSESSSSPSAPSWFSHFWSSALRSKPLVPPSETTIRATSGEGLVRRLSLFDLLLLGIGASIGAGIFVVTGTVAHDTGPGVTVSFIIAGGSCVLNALCYAELASRFPAVVGGAYLYAYTAFNEIIAFLVFSQLMLDYHIGAASIARSLASYVITALELIPFLNNNIPSWVGHGSEEIYGAFSFNLLAPILLVLLTIVLCRGVGESSILNSVMTVTKVVIVIFIIIVGVFEVDVSNWSPFAPNGFESVLTGATVVFFAYVGFDAVANSAEESKSPQRDLPLGIIGSLLICIALYVGVCLVLTGMLPYKSLGGDAPLADAFTSKGLQYVSVLISIGAIAGLTTTLLVGLYVQSRLYLGLGRDGLLPSLFGEVHQTRHTPVHSQIWVGIVASVLAGCFNVHILSHILSVGTLTGYSVVSACVVTLRWKDKTACQVFGKSISSRAEGLICLITVVCCGFAAGVFYRFGASFIFLIIAVIIAIFAAAALHFRQVYTSTPGFSCPGVPILPTVCIFINIFLFAQLHYEAWVRFVVLSIVTVGIYAVYGQYHANPLSSNTLIIYQKAPTEAD